MYDKPTDYRIQDGTDRGVRSGRVRLAWLTWEAILFLAILMVLALVFSSRLDLEKDAEPSECLDGHDVLLEALALSSDSGLLISSGADDLVRFWSLDPTKSAWGEEVMSLPHASRPYALAPSADGRFLAVGGNTSVAVWERRGDDWTLLATREGTEYRYLAFAPDSRSLAIGGEDGGIRILDVPSLKEQRVLKGLSDAVHSVAFSPDGEVLAAASFGGELVMWDWRTGVERPAIPGLGRVHCFRFTPDGRGLATARWVEGEGVTLWDLATAEAKAHFGSREGVNSLAFSPDGSLLAAAATDQSIWLWDVRTGEVRGKLDQGVGWVKTILFTTEGTRLAYGGRDGAIRFWNLSGAAVDDRLGSRPTESPRPCRQG